MLDYFKLRFIKFQKNWEKNINMQLGANPRSETGRCLPGCQISPQYGYPYPLSCNSTPAPLLLSSLPFPAPFWFSHCVQFFFKKEEISKTNEKQNKKFWRFWSHLKPLLHLTCILQYSSQVQDAVNATLPKKRPTNTLYSVNSYILQVIIIYHFWKTCS